MSKEKIVLPAGPLMNNLELVFSQTAWSKLMFFRHNADNIEVSGQGISFTKNLLMIDDFGLIKQECTGAHTEYDPDGWICFLEDMREDYRLIPRQCNNVWIHTHPGFSTNPSGTDEKNWRERTQQEARDFFVMCIVSNDDRSAYARLMITEPVRVVTQIPVRIDFSTPPPNLDVDALCEEFAAKVTKKVYQPVVKKTVKTLSKKNSSLQKDSFIDYPYSPELDYAEVDIGWWDWEDQGLELLTKEFKQAEKNLNVAVSKTKPIVPAKKKRS